MPSDSSFYSTFDGNAPLPESPKTPEASPVTTKIETSTPRRTAPREPASTRSQFNGNSVPIQLKLDSELIESLKLIAVSSKRSMSEIVMDCLTTNSKINKTWTTSRRDAA